MARSLYRPQIGNTVEDYTHHIRIFHQPSERIYTMLLRDGKYIQRRNQIGFNGQEANVVEKQVDFIVGSGAHARSYLHRNSDGSLSQLPVTWYSENGGYWAMSPGYDRAAQPDFRRAITGECLFCHDGYPKPAAEGNEENFGLADRIPEGIDCQRCHGPGAAHVRAASSKNSTTAEIHNSIVNPARLDRDRQLETCMQCHLETTSRSLPHAIRNYDRPAFSYRPGQPLGDYQIAFDRANPTDRNQGFEIAHAAYRLRMSLCFAASAMTCTTCHDPHIQTNGAESHTHYTAVCRSCHAEAHTKTPGDKTIAAGNNCIECHMPKRRTDDAVHVVMTDHFIQRQRGTRLTAPLKESDFSALDAYRGEVLPYYPAKPAAQIYTDVAQMKDGANVEAGIAKLEQDIERLKPSQPQVYVELADAYFQKGRLPDAIHWYQEALRVRPDFALAAAGLGLAQLKSGDPGGAVESLKRATAGSHPGPTALTNLGIAYLRQGDRSAAKEAVDRALGIDPDSPEALNLSGLLASAGGDSAAAEKFYREAITSEPEFAEAHFNLANLLAGAEHFPEAQFHFEKAIAYRSDYVEAHRGYASLLILTQAWPRAAAQLRDAIRLEPNSAPAHADLAHVLAEQHDVSGAIAEYRHAIQINPNLYEGHLALGALLAGNGRMAEAREEFSKAALSPDPAIRDMAARFLR